MKKAALLFVLVLAVIVPTVLHADAPVKEITPYFNDGIHGALSTENVFIRARWGACNRGLARQFPRAASISLTIRSAGIPDVIVNPPATEFWDVKPTILTGTPTNPSDYCIVNSDVFWEVEWLFELGTLAPGTYLGELTYSTTRPIHDGGEGDDFFPPNTPDGHIDGWPAGHEFLGGPYPFTIVVIDPLP